MSRDFNSHAIKWFLALTFGGSWGLWSLLWIFDVRLPNPDHMTGAQFMRFAGTKAVRLHLGLLTDCVSIVNLL